MKNALKFIALYIVQVGALWGLLEGYSYFKGDALKEFLGSYWILVYIIPLFITAYVMVRDARGDGAIVESITTQGDFSPGKVEGNYAVRKRSENLDQPDSSDDTPEENRQNALTKKPTKSIRTGGDYSPGEVGGDYTVDG